MAITKDAKYFANDPPTELLKLLISYGGEVDYMEKYSNN